MTTSGRNAAAAAAIAALLIVGACSKSETPSASSTTGTGTSSGGGPGGSATGGSTTAGSVPTYNSTETDITTAPDATFAVKLESNPSTGFSWTYTTQGDTVKFVDQKTEQGSGIGAPGATVFTFQGVKAGASQVTFTYARSTPAPDDKVLTYNVTVT